MKKYRHMTKAYAQEPAAAGEVSAGIPQIENDSVELFGDGMKRLMLPEEKDIGSRETENAIALLRRSMAERDNKIVLSFHTKDTPPSDIVETVYRASLVPTPQENEGDYLQFNIHTYHGAGEIRQVDDGYQTTLYYNISYNTTKDDEHAIAGSLDDLCDEWRRLDIRDRCVAIADYIRSNVSYDEELSSGSFSACSALLRGEATCQGYAELFYMLALRSDIPCRIITGDIKDNKENSRHAWNLVLIDNMPVHIDVTWYDGSGDSSYLFQDTQSVQERINIDSEYLDIL